MSKFLRAAAALALIVSAGAAWAEPLGLGRAATPEEVAAWDIDIRPDGMGLPDGRGDVSTGEEVFAEKCAVCHGDFAEGVDRWPVLAGGHDTLSSDNPVKTVGSYWPYLSTVWDYVRRAMPFGEAQSLSDDEVYAITAYILYANDLVEDDFELSRENFLETRLPNEKNFHMDDREQSPVFKRREACMKDCKASVEITARARVIDVTPDEDGGSTGSGDATPQDKTEAAPQFDRQLVAQGEKIFKKCKACHQVGEGAKNKVGPALNGIVGAPVAAVEGFKYSKALRAKSEEGEIWKGQVLDAFLTKPKAWAPGTKMVFAGLKKDEDRAAIIEFLRSVSR